jgi:hypothetical protein
MKKFVIIGFPKSGQNSLVEYLRKEHDLPVVDESGDPLVRRDECIWRNDGVKRMEDWDKKGYKCVIIDRDPVTRIWSSFHYFGYWQRMTWEQYLNYEANNERFGKSFGEENPIKQSRYEQWIKRFEKFDPLIYHMEEMKDKMPRINVTHDAQDNYTKKEIPQAFIDRVHELL